VVLVRTARPELVRRTLLLLEGSPAALERTDTLRVAAGGGIVCVWWVCCSFIGSRFMS
jgi:hypothetical protein